MLIEYLEKELFINCNRAISEEERRIFIFSDIACNEMIILVHYNKRKNYIWIRVLFQAL